MDVIVDMITSPRVQAANITFLPAFTDDVHLIKDFFAMVRTIRRSHFARLGVESLESREVLAGNVSAVLSGTTLSITGDVNDNSLNVVFEASRVVINGVSGTSINGGPAGGSAPLAFTGGTVKIALGAGGDSLILQGTIPKPTSLTVDLGAGVDQMNMAAGGTFTGTTKITLGADRELEGDALAFQTGAVFANLDIRGGGSGAGLGNGISQILPLNVTGNLSITNGIGFDSIELDDGLKVGGNFTIKNGDGGSEIELQGANDGTSFIGGALTVTNGAGQDDFVLRDFNVGRDININHGAGSTLGLAGSTVFIKSFNGGANEFRGNVTVTYKGGNGSDVTGIADTVVSGNVTFDYGTGNFTTIFDGLSTTSNVIISKSLTLKGTGANNVIIGSVQNVGLAVGGNFTATFGGGADQVQLFAPLRVLGATNLSLGDGNNTVSSPGNAFFVSLNGVTITGGKQVDTVTLPLTISKSITISLKEGDDSLTIADIFNLANAQSSTPIAAKVTIDLGAGNDTAALASMLATDAKLTLGEGNNVLTIGAVTATNVSVNGGSGLDQVVSSLPLTAANLTLNLGNGQNSLTTNNVLQLTKLDYTGGNGTDIVALIAGSIANLNVKLGDSTDELGLFALLSVPVSFNLDGGNGNDRLINAAPVQPPLNKQVKKNFEVG